MTDYSELRRLEEELPSGLMDLLDELDRLREENERLRQIIQSHGYFEQGGKGYTLAELLTDQEAADAGAN